MVISGKETGNKRAGVNQGGGTTAVKQEIDLTRQIKLKPLQVTYLVQITVAFSIFKLWHKLVHTGHFLVCLCAIYR